MSEPREAFRKVTCLYQVMPRSVVAVKLLRQVGCQVEFPPEQTCWCQILFR
ncbi:MAG: hypothetical protein H6651_04200 [Ardenticatenales bacterium]|nr:hypothetical protein [Ardenticatenales bacterium]